MSKYSPIKFIKFSVTSVLLKLSSMFSSRKQMPSKKVDNKAVELNERIYREGRNKKLQNDREKLMKIRSEILSNTKSMKK